MNKIISFFLTFLVLSVAAFAQNSLIHHEIDAIVNPSVSFLEVTDEITIPENLVSSELNFKLHNALTVSSLTREINIELINLMDDQEIKQYIINKAIDKLLEKQ